MKTTRWPLTGGALFLCTLLTVVPVTRGATPEGAFAEEEATSVEERRIRVSLQQERARLSAEFKKKEESLDLKELKLKTLEQEVDKKLNELRKLRDELKELLAREDAEKAKRVKKLSKIYEKMDPAKAAALLIQLDDELAIGILSGMKAKTAGSVLDSMRGERAAQLSKSFPTLRPE